MPFLPAFRKAKVEGKEAVGGGSRAALGLFRGSWKAGGMGVQECVRNGRAGPLGFAPVRGLVPWAP